MQRMDASVIEGLHFAGAGLAFLLTTLALLLLQPVASRLNLLDHPNDTRKDHAHPTPVTGGIAILVGCLAAFFGMQVSTTSGSIFTQRMPYSTVWA